MVFNHTRKLNALLPVFFGLDLSFILYLFIVHCYPGAFASVGNWLVVPVTSNISWLPISDDSITCPNQIFLPSEGGSSKNIMIEFTRPSSGFITKQKGVLCHKTLYVTYCDWGWFVNDVFNRLESAPVDDQECMAALNKWMEGRQDAAPPYPPADCKALAHTRIADTRVFISPHDVSFDPYANVLIDPTFPGGVFKGVPVMTPVPTIHEDMKWIALDQPGNNLCDMKTSNGFLYGNNWAGGLSDDDLNSIRIWGGDFIEKKLKGACRLKLCGMAGWKFSDGTWGTFKLPELDKQSVFGQITNFSPVCDKNTKVSSMTPESQVAMEQELLEKIVLNTRCLNTLSKIAGKVKISPLDLSHLAQTHLGDGAVYFFKNQALLRAATRYVLVNASASSGSEGTLGITMEGERIQNTHWETIAGTEYGPNGIMRKNGKIIFPSDILAGSLIEWDLLHPKFLHEIDSPSLAYHANNVLKNRQNFIYGTHNGSGWLESLQETTKALGEVTHDAWSSLIKGSLIFITLMISLCFLISCSKILISIRTKRTNHLNSIENSAIHPPW